LGLPSGASAQEVARVRVSTAVAGSGIIDVLAPAFTRDTGIIVQVSVAGSGRSLRDGLNGTVDLLFLNAPDVEPAFMAAGGGVIRRSVMRGHYVLVGPAGDPAGVASASSAAEAFQRIQDSGSMFVSRADDSGGHQREMAIWRLAGIEPYGDWYYEAGLGVRRTLALAEERRGYMLVDEATWLNFGNQQTLTVLYRGVPQFDDLYSVIAVNPARDEAVNLDHARRFIDWIASPPVQELIGGYEVKGVRPFEPVLETGR
jgi:tungstate transport system substrate-binding protein